MAIRFAQILPVIFAVFLFPQDSFSYSQSGMVLNDISTTSQRISSLGSGKQNGSLWKVGKSLDVKFSILDKINLIENPDLILPADRLVVEIKDDFTVVVTSEVPGGQSELPQPEKIKKAYLHVTQPSKEDIFAPEVPTAVFETPEFISKEPRRGPLQISKVFDSFFDFVQWMKAKFSSAHNYSSGVTLDPPSSAPYISSKGVLRSPLFSSGKNLFASTNFYQPYITESIGPPPRF